MTVKRIDAEAPRIAAGPETGERPATQGPSGQQNKRKRTSSDSTHRTKDSVTDAVKRPRISTPGLGTLAGLPREILTQNILPRVVGKGFLPEFAGLSKAAELAAVDTAGHIKLSKETRSLRAAQQQALWPARQPAAANNVTQAQQEEEATAFLRRIRFRNPEELFGEAQFLLSKGKEQDALHFVREVMRRDPGHMGGMQMVWDIFAKIRGPEAFDAAKSITEDFLRVRPNEATAHIKLADLISDDGLIFFHVEKALSLAPKNVDILMDAANIYCRIEVLNPENTNTPRYEQLWREVLECDPNHQDALLKLGSELSERGEYEAAQVLLERLIGVDPESVDGRYELAYTYLESKSWAKAEYHFQYLVAEGSSVASSLSGLIVALAKQKRIAEADALLTQHKKLMPALDKIALAELALEQSRASSHSDDVLLKSAQTAFEVQLQNTKSFEAVEPLREIYAAQKDWQRLRDFAERLLTLDPHLPLAREIHEQATSELAKELFPWTR